MPTSRYIQSSFTSGELSPRLAAHVDFNKRANGLSVCENYLPTVHGPVVSRSGTRFVAETKTSSSVSVLIPFEFSTIQAYVLEFGNFYIRMYKDGGRIESPPGTPVEVVTGYVAQDVSTIKWAQSADTLYLAHGLYPPRKLTRTSHTAWSIQDVDFVDGPYLDENITSTTITPSGTAVGASITLTASTSIFQSGHVNSLWRIKVGASYGYVKVTAYTDSTHVTATVKKVLGGTTATTLWREGAWSSIRGYPTCVTIHEQRLTFGGTATEPQTIYASVSDSYEDFTPGTADSDAFTYTLGSNKVNVLRWLSSGSALIPGTVGEEFLVDGPNSSALTPSNVRARSQTAHGSSPIPAVRIGASTVFVQRSSKKVRQLTYSSDQEGQASTDLTLLAQHIAGTGFSAMAYQQEPDTWLWCVRKDGQLASLTFLPAQEVAGWARHITDGSFESVAVIPSTDLTSDTPWFIVNRTIGGVTKRYVEYMDPLLSVDSGLSYDGGITTASLTPSAGTGSTTFTASAAVFVSGDVGKDIVLTDPVTVGSTTYTVSRATITAFTDSTHVTATISREFPVTAIPADTWGLAVQSVSGLSHLEGKTVSLVGDGAVYPAQTVTGGIVTLSGMKATVIHAGLAFTPKITLFEPEVSRGAGDTVLGLKKRYAKLYVRVYQTTGVWINGLLEVPSRSTTDLMGAAVAPFTGDIKASQLGYETGGVVTIEQRLPLSSTILGVWGTVDYADD